MIYVLSFILTALALTGMALGLILRKKPLKKGCCRNPEEDAASCRCRNAAIPEGKPKL